MKKDLKQNLNLTLAVLTFLFAIFIYIQPLKSKPSFLFENDAVLISSMSNYGIEDLSLSFGEKQVDNLNIIDFRFWNEGFAPIRVGDIIADEPFIITPPIGCQVIGVFDIHYMGDDDCISYIIQNNVIELKIKPTDEVRRKDGIRFSILYSGISLSSTFSFTGDLKNGSIRNNNSYFILAMRFISASMIAIGTFIAILGFNDIGLFQRNSKNKQIKFILFQELKHKKITQLEILKVGLMMVGLVHLTFRFLTFLESLIGCSIYDLIRN